MTYQRWQQLKEVIVDNYKLLDEGEGKLTNRPGRFEFIVFKGPLGIVKLQFEASPRYLGEKTQFSKRIGASVTVKKIYDESETVNSLKAFKKNEAGEWEIIDPEHFTGGG